MEGDEGAFSLGCPCHVPWGLSQPRGEALLPPRSSLPSSAEGARSPGEPQICREAGHQLGVSCLDAARVLDLGTDRVHTCDEGPGPSSHPAADSEAAHSSRRPGDATTGGRLGMLKMGPPRTFKKGVTTGNSFLVFP